MQNLKAVKLLDEKHLGEKLFNLGTYMDSCF